MKPRRITNEELANLSEAWEHPTVDTSKYYQSVLVAYEIDQETYLASKRAGHLVQKVWTEIEPVEIEGGARYYVAGEFGAPAFERVIASWFWYETVLRALNRLRR